MKIVEAEDTRYPDLLKQITDPPKRLYYKGDWDVDIFRSCLAVVGSRRMTSYGRRITDELVSKAALSGITIVSGFMFGVDAQAHRAAVSVGGRTIAVMPCGIDLIHPAHQEDLYAAILENDGLIISEYEADAPPVRWMYPARNRIVAGLSQATLVVEGALKSGSLITADLTKKFGRKLFAIPGPLTSPVSQGTLQLIKEGASMVTGIEDILEYYGVATKRSSASRFSQPSLNKLEQSIVEALAQEPREVDILSRLVGVPASQLGATLSLMQLKGLINEERGKFYVGKSGVGA